MGFGINPLEAAIMSKNPFFLTSEFYKNLFAASAILQKPNSAGTSENGSNKIIEAQNFARNLLFGGDEKEVKWDYIGEKRIKTWICGIT
jgi:hypothetical protein